MQSLIFVRLSGDSPHSALGVGRVHSVMLRGRKLKLCESDLPNKCHVELTFCHAPLEMGAQWRLVIGQGSQAASSTSYDTEATKHFDCMFE